MDLQVVVSSSFGSQAAHTPRVVVEWILAERVTAPRGHEFTTAVVGEVKGAGPRSRDSDA
jgi:hypothetical protein